MKVKQCKVNTGGLMRCCLKTLEERAEDEVQEEDRIKCRYCQDDMIVVKGLIQWDHRSESNWN